MVGYPTSTGRTPASSCENKDFANDGLGADNIGSGDWMKQEGEIGMSSYKEDNKLIAFFGRISYDYAVPLFVYGIHASRVRLKFGKPQMG